MKNFTLYQKDFFTELNLSRFGFKECNEEHDVVVKISKKAIPNKFKEKVYSINDNYGYYYKQGVGLYEVFNGEEIIIRPETESNELLSQYLINFPLALCFSQLGFFVLHSSAVKFKDKVILFCGKSHSGKSTTSALFNRYGAKIISEDICIVDTKTLEIIPSAPYVKLTKQAATSILQKHKKISTKTMDSRDIYQVGIFEENRSNLNYCFFMNWGQETGIDAIDYKDIIKKLYKFSFISNSRKDTKKVLSIISNTKFKNLYIKKSLDQLDIIVDKVTEEII